jgi:transcriptional regulator CtsR
MARPINPYQGPAPAAMAQMGQGILEAGANAARITQAGYESMGKSLAGGINTAVAEYSKYKEDQSKFDATKKLFKAFSGSLSEDEQKSIQEIFDDTSISTREKNLISPAIMQYIGNVQQQKGREKIADIMTESREAIAAAKNQPRPLPEFDATQGPDLYNQPAGQAPAPAPAAPYMIQRPPATPQPVQQQPRGKMPLTRWNPDTKEYEFLDPRGTRYVPMGADFSIVPFQ